MNQDFAVKINQMQEALGHEIRASSSSPSQNIDVSEGRLVSETNEGFLYVFLADQGMFVPPESPIVFKLSGLSVRGTWIAQNEFEILILLKESIGPAVRQGKVKIDFTYILDELSKKLGELENAPGIEILKHLLCIFASNLAGLLPENQPARAFNLAGSRI